MSNEPVIIVPIEQHPWHRGSEERNRIAREMRAGRAFLRPPMSGKVRDYEIERAEDRLIWNRRLARALRNGMTYVTFCLERKLIFQLTRSDPEQPFSREKVRKAWAAEIRDARLPYTSYKHWQYADDQRERAYVMARKLRSAAHKQLEIKD